MKNGILLCLIGFMLFSFSTFEKKVLIKGNVMDKNSKSPLSYATVTVLDSETKLIVAGEITNENGQFQISVKNGKYDIKIEYLSFKSFIKDGIELQSDYDMKLIYLEPDGLQMDEIEIVEERSTIEYKLDKKVFNVGKDLMSKGGNVTDILDNVPSVSVNVGGGVSLRGNSNVKVLINGKPSVLTANGGLEQLPANMVSQVEVITNPSAKYEASGTAGIINIILKKNKDGGIGGSVSLTAGYPDDFRANLNLNYKKEKINLFSNIGYRYSNFFGEGTRLQKSNTSEGDIILNQILDEDRNDDHYNIYVGGDYYINDKNTVTASFYHNKLVNTDLKKLDYIYSSIDNQEDSVISRVINYREPQNFNQLEIDYVRTFDKKGKKFTANVQFDFWNDDENESITESLILPNNLERSNLKSRDIESSKDLLLQADYETTFGEHSSLEAGFRGQIRRITSEYTVSIDGENLPAYDNLLNYDEGIYGAYAQYGYKRKKFSYLLGLRTELSDIGVNDEAGKFNKEDDYINLFPTVHLTYNFSQMMNMQLSYSKRIDRPRFWQLNPFGGYEDNRNLFAGNPDLSPMYTNSFELGMLRRWEKFTFNPSFYFQRTNDFFQFVTTQNELGYFESTPVNLDHEDRMGLELSMSYNPLRWLRLSGEVNLYAYKEYGSYGGVNFDTEDKTFSARLNSRMRFLNGLSVQFQLRYRGANQSGQVYRKAMYMANLAISKDLMNDKASISIRARNIFDSRVEELVVTGDNYELESTSKRHGARISATFSYKFNRKKGERDRMHN